MPVARLTDTNHKATASTNRQNYQLLSKTPDNSIRKAISGLPKPLPAVLKYPPAIHLVPNQLLNNLSTSHLITITNLTWSISI